MAATLSIVMTWIRRMYGARRMGWKCGPICSARGEKGGFVFIWAGEEGGKGVACMSKGSGPGKQARCRRGGGWHTHPEHQGKVHQRVDDGDGGRDKPHAVQLHPGGRVELQHQRRPDQPHRVAGELDDDPPRGRDVRQLREVDEAAVGRGAGLGGVVIRPRLGGGG